MSEWLAILAIVLFIGPAGATLMILTIKALAERTDSMLVGVGVPYLLGCGWAAAWTLVLTAVMS